MMIRDKAHIKTDSITHKLCQQRRENAECLQRSGWNCRNNSAGHFHKHFPNVIISKTEAQNICCCVYTRKTEMLKKIQRKVRSRNARISPTLLPSVKNPTARDEDCGRHEAGGGALHLKTCRAGQGGAVSYLKGPYPRLPTATAAVVVLSSGRGGAMQKKCPRYRGSREGVAKWTEL
jgi:hypothetical protein